ncbi:nucleolar protein 14-like [Diadema setosum]|uniref:nucleolar protein 14-like n=1 Tax=Diadema setosum TaxID=31175 RepID=UPI003B3B745F
MAKNKKRKQNSTKVQNRTRQPDNKPNPFEVKINKQKHSILGKKNKHGKGMPLVSRSKGLQKRNATLLQEYKHRNKTNKFLDRRLGENDPEMSVEEKMMERFALEKQRSHEKSSIFSLNADEELTHYGQSLSSMEKFEEPQLESDDDEDGRINKQFVAEQHFGGFLTKKKSEEDGKPKTRHEIFEEIIAKSKKEKYNRQSEKEDVTNLTEQLDKDFMGVAQFIASVKRDREREKIKPDAYDMSVKELIFDMRAQASDRMKTPEELAKEERERLEKLEADRQRRMKGITEEEEAEMKRRVQSMSADDLNDGFELALDKRTTLTYDDGVPSFGLGTDGKREDANEVDDDDEEEDEDNEGMEGDDSDGDDDDDDNGSEDGEESNDGEDAADNASDLESEPSDDEEVDNEDDDDEDDDFDNEKEVDESKSERTSVRKSSLKKDVKGTKVKKVQLQEPAESLKKREDMITAAKKELPYTFKAPENLEEFEQLIEGHSVPDQLVIISRVRKCHHPSLAEGNKEKLGTLTCILQEHLGGCVGREEGIDLHLINGLTKHIYELTQTCALTSGNNLQAIISKEFDAFNEEAEQRGRAFFPSLHVLMYFKLVSVLFPTSDFRHSVVTPTMLFMGAILSQCRVRSLQDMTSGLFVCNLFLKYVSLSKRFVPEAINFLRGILFMASDHETTTGGLVVAPFKHTGRFAKLLRNDATLEAKLKPVSIFQLLSQRAEVDEAEYSCWAVALSCHLLKEFSQLYVDLPSYQEVFLPIQKLLSSREKLLNKYPEEVKSLGEELLTHIEAQSQRPRRVLQVEKKKPAPLKMFEPKIEDSYDPTRKHRSSGNKDYDERQRLVHRHRREMKGAIREIRKDSQFIARQKLEEQKERDDERKEKVKRLHAMLANQEGDFRAIKRTKKKL